MLSSPSPLQVPGPARGVRFGPFEADLHSGELRKHGRRIKLQDQPFQVLALLLERPGEVVTREELRQKLWPADTFVDFDVGLNTAIKRLRDALGDTAESPRYVETLPRRGYRFIAPVAEVLASVNRASSSPNAVSVAGLPGSLKSEATALPPALPETETKRIKTTRRPYALALGGLIAGALLVLLAIAVGLNLGGWRQRLLTRADAGRIPSIAVLPFKNLSSEPASDYFSDGLTDEIIHNLSIIDGLQVRSRTSSFAFKDKPRNIHEVGVELGVNLVLEGSVLRSGD